MQSPKVTIIVPVYGVEQYVSRCAESLFEQTYDNIEVIFVNDCTKDRSIEVIEDTISKYPKLKEKTRIINHEVNKGLAAARITGLMAATGEYVTHVDSDDYAEHTMVEKLVKKAQESGSDIVCCGFAKFTPTRRKELLPQNISKEALIEKILYNSIPGSCWGKLYKMELYKNHPDAWPIEGINHGEDYVTIPRLLYYSNSLEYVSEALYNYNIGNQSSYTQNFTRKSMDNMVACDEVLMKFFKGKLSDEVIYKMLLRSKTAMLKCGNSSLFGDIIKLYDFVPKEYVKQLSFIDRFYLKCAGTIFNPLLVFLSKAYRAL